MAAHNPDIINRTGDEKHRTFINEQRRLFTQARDYFVTETNETERSLCAQLMLVDTVLVTGTLVATSDKDLFDSLTDPNKLLILGAIVLLLLSVASGIRYYFSVLRYYDKWSAAKDKALNAFLDNGITTWQQLRTAMDDAQHGIGNQVEATWLRLQILFMAAAAVYYLIALATLFFNIEQIVTPIISQVHCL